MTDLLPVRSDLCHGPSCTEKITEASPSQDFHSAACQQRWHARWAGVSVDQDVEPTASGMEPTPLMRIEWEEIFRSLEQEGHTFTPDTTPITMAAPADFPDKYLWMRTAVVPPSMYERGETFASLIPDEPPTPKRTGALPALWAWLRGKR